MNPFKYGQVVSAEDFCPRPQLIKEIMSFIKSGQNLCVQGERRVGKTSLIEDRLTDILSRYKWVREYCNR